jgi:hypothetical protein
MDMTSKRSIMVVVAAAFAAVSTSALAENGATEATNAAPQSKSAAVKLSDAELDRITAGTGAMSEVVMFNPGKAEVQKMNHSHFTCINCDPLLDVLLDAPEGTSGFMNVLLPNGRFVMKTIRRPLF